MRVLVQSIFCVSLLASFSASASAKDSPWSEGVSEQARAKAGELFGQGNKLMDEAFWKEASARYLQALKLWDNPAIRGNLAICLLNLDQPIEGFRHMKEALQYGEAPFTPGAYRNLQTSERLLRGQIAELEIRSGSGTRILLDGKVQPAVFNKSLILRPGPHRIEGYRDEHLARNEVINLVPGKQHQVEVQLDSFSDASSYSRRWSPWKTWAVAGGAGVLALGSTALFLQARVDREDYSAAVDAWCAPQGCQPGGVDGEIDLPQSFIDTKDRAELLQTLGIVTTAASGAMLIGSGIMWFYNRPQRSMRSDYEENLPLQISITPQPGGAGISSSFRF
jgi:hypothetical protein